jgi:cob(I)alamin adenosyltransferase
MSIATKTGDGGETALMFGVRVSKNDPRVAAYGTCDELNAALGMVRAFCETPEIREAVLSVQRELVALMGELAVADPDRDRYREKGYPSVDASMVSRLDGLVRELETDQKISYRGWATPGETRASACLDVARTACRRAERAVVALMESGGGVNPEAIRYLNRLSDLCWLYARAEETRAGDGEAPARTGSQ